MNQVLFTDFKIYILGKSTLFKQMKLIYRFKYSKEEKRKYRESIYKRAIQGLQKLIPIAQKQHILEEQNEVNFFEKFFTKNRNLQWKY